MKKLLKWYLSISLLVRILAGLFIGCGIGIALWWISSATGQPVATRILKYISPFGLVLVNMLKMIVIPVIFFSLITGAASLPLSRFGHIGAKVIGWYLLCSLLAATVGVIIALLVNPGSGADLQGWQEMVKTIGGTAKDLEMKAKTSGTFVEMILNMFQNPFAALSEANFLGIIVFSIMFGLGIRVVIESTNDQKRIARLENVMDIFVGIRDGIFKMVDWILEYTPIGVLFLSIINFGVYGPNIAGPYIKVALGIIAGILGMVFIVYPGLLAIVTRKNPYVIMKGMEEAIITAFITRSSAATLPVTLRTIEEKLKVKNELASFSLPLGATINMDGVCVHLPMFAVLSANMFNIDLTMGQLFVLVILTVLASIGAGGVPGGSLMLMFIILGYMDLTGVQVSVIVALALGINPILDMFETANNVTGDMVCTYAVADQEGLIDKE